MLGVCILNWNAGNLLRQCLEAASTHLAGVPHQIVVVDNASTDSSCDGLEREFPNVSVIRNPTNVGFAKGNNIGARTLIDRGSGSILFLNPDVSIGPHTVPAMMSTLAHDPKAGCCGGLPENRRGVSRMACRTRPTPMQALVLYGVLDRLPIFRPLRARHFLGHESLSDGAPIHAVSGACMLVRAEAFQAVDGFDEATFLYAEEFILSERLGAKGWQVVISTQARYFHHEGWSTNQIPNLRRVYFIQSEQHLIKTYYRWPVAIRVLFWLTRRAEFPAFALRNALSSARAGGGL